MTNDAFLRALGWALAHSLWQATAVALLLLILLPRLKSAQQRYWAAYSGMLAVFVAAITTFFWVYTPIQQPAASYGSTSLENTGTALVVVEIHSIGGSFWQTCTVWLENNHALIVAIWLLGFVFFLLRLGGGLWQMHRLRTRGVAALEPLWQERFDLLRQRLGYKRTVALLESTLVQTPIAIGWLKPFVLLPIGLVNRLSVAEVEAVLAHELAHIARRDWVFNLIQAFIESLFYHHPAVWWMSGVVRRERENCCDDAALAATGNPLAFAKALVQVQELAIPVPVLALAMSGANRRRPLLDRVRRILNQPQQKQQQVMEKITATVILLALLALVGMKANSVPAIEAVFSQISDIPTALFGHENKNADMLSDSLPKPKSTRKIIREDDDQRVEAEYKDGKLSRLNIDGKEIPASEFPQHEALAAELMEDTAPPAPPAPPDGIWAPSAPGAPRAFWFSSDAPTPPGAPYPPMPRGSSSIRVFSDKDDQGNTIIRLDNNGEATEVVVKDNEVYVNGKKLEEGAELEIPGMQFGAEGFHFAPEGFGFHFEGLDAEGLHGQFEQLEHFSDGHKRELERAMEEHRRAFSENQREYRQQMREAQKEMKRSQKEWEKDQKRFQKEQELWQKEQLNWHKHQEKWAIDSKAWQQKANAVKDALKSELLKDGLISNPEEFSLEVNDKELKVNKKKQSEAMRQKYMELLQGLNGADIKGKAHYHYNYTDDDK
jgi:bla regulator protein blaR1